MAGFRARVPATVFLLGLTSFFADVGSDMVFPLLPLFVTGTLGAGTGFLGLVEGVADATASILKLTMGFVADGAARRKPLIVFGYGIAGVARPLVAFATAPWHVLAIRVVDRVGKGTRSTPRDVLIAASVSADRVGAAFGFHRAMDHAGAVAGPLIAAGLLALGYSLRTVFLWAAIPSALSIAAAVLVREPQVPAITAAANTPAAPPQPMSQRLKRYFGVLLVFSIGNSSDAFLLLRAKDMGVAVAAIPLLWMVLHVSKLASSYVGGSWADRVPRVRLIAAGWLVFAVAYVALAFAPRAWLAWPLFAVYGTYYGLSEPAEKALVRDLAPTERRGRAFGAYNFITGASAIPASVLAGYLWQRYGAAPALLVGAGFATIAAACLALWVAPASAGNARGG